MNYRRRERDRGRKREGEGQREGQRAKGRWRERQEEGTAVSSCSVLSGAGLTRLNQHQSHAPRINQSGCTAASADRSLFILKKGIFPPFFNRPITLRWLVVPFHRAWKSCRVTERWVRPRGPASSLPSPELGIPHPTTGVTRERQERS